MMLEIINIILSQYCLPSSSLILPMEVLLLHLVVYSHVLLEQLDLLMLYGTGKMFLMNYYLRNVEQVKCPFHKSPLVPLSFLM